MKKGLILREALSLTKWLVILIVQTLKARELTVTLTVTLENRVYLPGYTYDQLKIINLSTATELERNLAIEYVLKGSGWP